MKILLITQHYSPEQGFVTSDIAEFLSAEGHQVTVLTAHPNYPHGKFFDSVKSLWPTKKMENGLSVWRLPFYPYHGLSKVRRFISYLSFASIAALFAPFVCARPKLVLVYQTPFTSALASFWHKYVLRSKLAFICADLWPESFTASGVAPNSFLLNLMYSYSKWINFRANLLICTSQGIMKRYASDGIPQEKLTLIPVWTECPPKDIGINFPNNLSPVIVYAGNMGPAQKMDFLVEAASILQSKKIGVQINIYGIGSELEKLTKLADSLGLVNISFHGRVAPELVIQAIQASDAQIVHLAKTSLFSMTIPSKLLFSLSLGKPIFCGLTGESLNIAESSGAALVFSQESGSSFAESVEKFITLSPETRKSMGNKAREYYLKNYEKTELLIQYGSLLTEKCRG